MLKSEVKHTPSVAASFPASAQLLVFPPDLWLGPGLSLVLAPRRHSPSGPVGIFHSLNSQDDLSEGLEL